MAFAIVSASAIAAAATWLMIRLAPALGLVDRPNERSSHKQPTPRGGGVAIVAAVLIVASLAVREHAGLLAPLLFSLPIAALGLIDDRFGLSAGTRLGVQLLVSVAFVFTVSGSTNGVTPLVGALAIAWACNLFNFMDGIDGIASMEATFICAVAGGLLWAIDPSVAAMLYIVAASSAGFLPWNWAPARVFMGDVGSAFLGFLIAAVAYVTVRQGHVNLAVWMILWSLFLADTAVTLLRRMLRGERWWIAHRSHAYQHLTTRLGHHAPTTLLYAGINLLLVLPSAWIAQTRPVMAWPICVSLLLMLSAAAYTLGGGRPAGAPR